jgi:O-phosphoseryl-tRNA(Cys) synthetase
MKTDMKIKKLKTREMKLALSDAEKYLLEKKRSNVDVKGLVNVSVAPIHLNKLNAELVKIASQRLKVTPDEFVNQLILKDLEVAKEFCRLSDEIKDLID